MLRPILVGLDAEYGLQVEGRGAADQIDDATALVREISNGRFVGWDYRHESPRSDLRGFQLSRLAVDPLDAQFDAGKKHLAPHEVRSDRILANGARFYNDHGHPEYATPECWSIFEVARHDHAGARVVLESARALAEREQREVRVYKNNTDYHGASYGTHEGYSVPRAVGFDRLFRGLLPLMVVRQVLVGAGKVGAETGKPTRYQLSQRGDFFVEPANAETLYRRPIFNTRDEPHANPRDWIRLHVICGESNMISNATARKIGLLKLGIHLVEANAAPVWKLADPVRAIQSVSRDMDFRFEIPLEGRSWTNAYEVFESYFAAAEATLDLDEELRWTIDTSRTLLQQLTTDFSAFRREVDWAAKHHVLEQAVEDLDEGWSDPALRAYDLEYHNADPEESLHAALVAMGEVSPDPDEDSIERCLSGNGETTRARARGIAVRKFGTSIVSAGWRSITFDLGDELAEIELLPDGIYPAELEQIDSLPEFLEALSAIKRAEPSVG